MSSATLLDGKVVSQRLLDQVREEVDALVGRARPKLVAVIVGEDPASEVYVGRKMKVAAEVGIESELLRFPASIQEFELREELQKLNNDPSVHAILVQQPFPKHIRTNVIVETISPEKDVDGFHAESIGNLVLGVEPAAMACTPAGIIHLLDAYEINLEGMRAAVVGRSNIVGKPISMMLLHRNATVTMCHSRTHGLDDILRQSDLIVAAAGQPGLIRAECIKPGAVVVDVGINRLPNGKLTGDVDFEAACQHAGYITPVPGGVGPMTIAMLMMNTVRLCKQQQGLRLSSLLFA